MKTTYSKSMICNFKKIPLALVIGMLCFGCGENKEEIIRQKVAENLQDFRQKKLTECREVLLREAEEIVDSLLLMEATDALSDSLSRLRPTRPMQPPAILPIDSLKVHPIFESPASPPDSGNKGG